MLNEIELPAIINKPLSLAMAEDGTLWVAGTSGTFKISRDGQLLSTICGGICHDVSRWESEKRMVVMASKSFDVRKGPQAESVFLIFDEEKFSKPMFELGFPYELGRPRKVVVSKSGWLFLSTKHESVELNPCKLTGKQADKDLHQSIIWRLKVDDWVRGKGEAERLIAPKEANMWFMAISEHFGGMLAVSDRCNDTCHAVNIYDFDGNKLRNVVEGHKDHRLPGSVVWPRGVAFDSTGTFVYVVDEGLRIQKFRVENGKFEELVVQIKGSGDIKPIVYNEKKLYFAGFKLKTGLSERMGSHQNKPRHRRAFLFIKSV